MMMKEGGTVESKEIPLEIETGCQQQDSNYDEEEKHVPQKVPSKEIVTRSILSDWCFSLLIGILVVSFWRGGWTLIDLWTCNQPGDAGLTVDVSSFCFAADGGKQVVRLRSAINSFVYGYLQWAMGWFLMVRRGYHWNPILHSNCCDAKDASNSPTTTFLPHRCCNDWNMKVILRFVIILLLGNGTIGIWHGIWYFLDYYLLPDNPVQSYRWSAIVGAAVCYLLGAGNSLLAPPAIYIMDGPTHLPPPIGNRCTLLKSFRSIAYPAAPAVTTNAQQTFKEDPLWLDLLDAFGSYFVLPWGVVAFWRGTWNLMDYWFWGFTPNKTDLYLSLLWSALLSLLCLVVASEDVVCFFQQPISSQKCSLWVSHLAIGIMSRIFTFVLAVGTVNFWRVVWYVWDEFLGLTYVWSAASSYCLGIFGLLALGCFSCVTAPPSTIGVDAIAHPDCADEPLFHKIPVPAESIHVMAFARRPVSLNTVMAQGQKAETPQESGTPSAKQISNVLDSIDENEEQDNNSPVPIEMLRQAFAGSRNLPSNLSTRHLSPSNLLLSSRRLEMRKNDSFFRSR